MEPGRPGSEKGECERANKQAMREAWGRLSTMSCMKDKIMIIKEKTVQENKYIIQREKETKRFKNLREK